MGNHHFMLTRNALRGNHLNLGEWHGFNEVHFNHSFEAKTISGEFKLADNAYLSVLFNRNESGYFGVRLSRNPEFKNILFHSDRHNRFTMTKLLNSIDLNSNWNDFRLDFSNGQLAITVDRWKLGTFDIQALHEQFFGFRSGYWPAAVDNIRVIDTSGSLILDENFRNENNYSRFLTIASVLVIAAFLFVLCILKRQADTVRKNTANWLLSIQMIVFMISAMYFCFDFYYWSGRYAYEGFTPWGRVNRSYTVYYEKIRMKLFGTDYNKGTQIAEQIIPHPDLLRSVSKWNLKKNIKDLSEVVTIYSTQIPEPQFVLHNEVYNISPTSKKMIRVGFIGTSQTAGAGAEVVTDTLVSKTHLALYQSCPNGDTIESYDFAISGSNSTKLLEMYKKHWVHVSPDVLVINIAGNDSNPSELADNLRTFVQINNSKSIRTIFLLEAYTPELRWSKHTSQHESVKNVAKEFEVLVIDLYSYLNSDEVYDSGFLWWDCVHLTSYGQDLAAQWLTLKLQPTFMEMFGQ